MFHKLKPLQRRRDIHSYIPIVIYSKTLPCAHAVNMQDQVMM